MAALAACYYHADDLGFFLRVGLDLRAHGHAQHGQEGDGYRAVALGAGTVRGGIREEEAVAMAASAATQNDLRQHLDQRSDTAADPILPPSTSRSS